MIKLYENGVYLLNGTEIVEDTGSAQVSVSKEEAAKNTIAYGIVQPYNEKGGNIFRKRISGKTSRPFSGYDIFFQALSLEIFIHNTAG